jgi:uncharacterized membrane protein (DUF4010 family)
LDIYLLFKQLGLSVLLGLLVGLQREQKTYGIRPGIRTFPLITVFGTVAALLSNQYGGWILAAGLVGVVSLVMLPHILRHTEADHEFGTTTDMAAMLMYGVGALLVVAPLPVAVSIGGGVAVLLQFKPEMHGFAKKLGERDLKAIMQFVLITCIILPLLPNKTFGPFDVFNPFEMWLLVVLIVGMSLGGYIAYKFFGRNAGILLGGFLGGAVSSTATSVSYSRRGLESYSQRQVAAIVIMIASTVVFIRVLIEIAVVSPKFLLFSIGPILIVMGLALTPALILWYRFRNEPSDIPEQENPTQLRSALTFGVLYAVILFALAASEKYVGEQGLYAVAAFSGLTDMDAITLSTARMALEDERIMKTGWRLIIIGALANLVFKAGIIRVIGDRRLFWQIVKLFALPLIGGLLLLWLWPV